MNESIIDDDDVFEEFEKDARLKHVFSSKVVKWSHHHRHPPSTNQNGQHMANKYSYGH
jgi:hypothetical protein